MPDQFKPNIYPIMYWALAYGVIAGFLLFLVFLLSRFITIVWFPVFLVGLIWGGYRNYLKQKKIWATQSGVPLTPKSPVQEFKEAVSDVTDAAREMVAQNRAEDEAAIQEEADEAQAVEDELLARQPAEVPPETTMPPAPPTPPVQPDRPTP